MYNGKLLLYKMMTSSLFYLQNQILGQDRSHALDEFFSTETDQKLEALIYAET